MKPGFVLLDKLAELRRGIPRRFARFMGEKVLGLACQAVVSEREVRLRRLAKAQRATAGQPSLSAALRAKAGAGGRIRTDDPLITNQKLCH